MLSRLQELRREEETLLRVKAALHDQLTPLKGAAGWAGGRYRPGSSGVRPRVSSGEEAAAARDGAGGHNQTELHVSLQDPEEEEEEESNS
ncbi:uncharacterized protein O3Q21_013042 [Podargus strigoides]